MTKGAAQSELSRRLTAAIEVAQVAAAHALTAFQDSSLHVELKPDRSVVTAADREAERLARELIAEQFSQDSIEGEEFGKSKGNSAWTWHLDPIDGTQAFVRGVPLFGTLVGMEQDGQPVIGVICLPALGEMVFAAKGMGCHWTRGLVSDGRGRFVPGRTVKAVVSGVRQLRDALFCTTWMQSYVHSGRPELYGRLTAATGVARGWGDCYGYALVATGRAEVMVDPELFPWDAAPMPVILAEAGGRFTTFQGTDDIRGGTAVATNGYLHEETLAVIGEAHRGGPNS